MAKTQKDWLRNRVRRWQARSIGPGLISQNGTATSYSSRSHQRGPGP